MSPRPTLNVEILGKLRSIDNFKYPELIKLLLRNRGVKTSEFNDFLNPDLSKVTAKNVGINLGDLERSIKRVKNAIKKKEKIVIFGDYDVDGICGSAILWETLRDLEAQVLPYIPNRFEEGYGLSKAAITNLKSEIPDVKLVITVDNGIVAGDGTEFAKSLGVDVIITDHHVSGDRLPKAFSIVHTTRLCGAGVAYILAKEIRNPKSEIRKNDDHLELVCLATIADLVPLTGANRTLVSLGIKKLRETKRPGLIELFKEAEIEASEIDTYVIGHIIAPRLNAMGRMEDAMDSLRLLCTKNSQRAKELAKKLGDTNRIRQTLTIDTFYHAKAQADGKTKKKLLFVHHESYPEGIIGLVAGRLTEEYYLPSIVISKGKKISKASARSISGFNIIEFIRNASEFLVDAGGHPMAAGFTFETKNLNKVEKKFQELAEKAIKKELLLRKRRIDCEIALESVSLNLYNEISKLEPFGMGNPTPVFLSRNIEIIDVWRVGAEKKHLKLKFQIPDNKSIIDGIWFGIGDENVFKIGDKVSIVYSLSLNEWNGVRKVELRLKDLILENQSPQKPF
ncbi:MAG: Single-stranded-DNA-specific exonuclease RecJ [Candidatus Levybacteria bacterium GW2011_GWA2_40_8]|nr:MAG: Single-stranded-DNA-specific exonuclease RecJ [Candidatus Levybacteria bacterium GW2011_GWA2_40_8]